MQFWQSEPHERLTQGDYVESYLWAQLGTPLKLVVQSTFKGGASGWAASSNSDFAVAKLIRAPAVVLTYSCELDKKTGSKEPAIVAPVRPYQGIDEAVVARIRAGEVLSRMHISSGPGFDEGYVDMRFATATQRGHLTRRLATMTEEAQAHLCVRIAKFFTRCELQVADAS